MRIGKCLGLALGATAMPVAAQTVWQDQVVNVAPAHLLRGVVGTWYEIDPSGAPHKSLFSPGIKGCDRPAEGEYGGDISFRRGANGFEAAWLGGSYEAVRPTVSNEGPVPGLQLGRGVIHMLQPAPDGTPRIHIGGKTEMTLQKCPAKAP